MGISHAPKALLGLEGSNKCWSLLVSSGRLHLPAETVNACAGLTVLKG